MRRGAREEAKESEEPAAATRAFDMGCRPPEYGIQRGCLAEFAGGGMGSKDGGE